MKTTAVKMREVRNWLLNKKLVDSKAINEIDSICYALSADSIFSLMDSNPDTFEDIARGVRNSYFDGYHDGYHKMRERIMKAHPSMEKIETLLFY